MATSKKTLQLDLLQLNSLNFLTSSNTPIPSSFVLYARGNGTTSFDSISSIVSLGYNTITIPGQRTINSSNTSNVLTLSSLSRDLILSTTQISSIIHIGIPSLTSTINSTINSVVASTMFNILTYPNIYSSIYYRGNTGLTPFSTLANNASLSNSGSAFFSSLSYNFSSFSQYINPNGSSRVFVEYFPNFTFSPVVTPSSISSLALYPDNNSSIKNIISLSTHMIYTNAGSNVPVVQSGTQQYINLTSIKTFSTLTANYIRPLSNSFAQTINFELDSLAVRSNFNFGLLHYISDGVSAVKSDVGFDVLRTGFERPSTIINMSVNDRNIIFMRIINSGNAV